MTTSEVKAALAVIDMQEDFCEPNGSLAVKQGRELAGVINKLLTWPGFTVKVATRDFHPADHISFASSHSGADPFSSHTIRNPENEAETQITLLWPDHCVQGTKGCELIPELHQDKLSHIVNKGMDKRVESYSAFGPPFRSPAVALSNLKDTLTSASITHVFVVGLAFDYCVKCTALDAAEHGFKTFVIKEGTNPVSRVEKDRVATVKELEAKGVKVIGLDSEELSMIKNK